MKVQLIAAPFVLAVALTACTPPAQEAPPPAQEAAIAIDAPSGDYTLDKNHSSLTLRADHFGLSHYTLRFTNLDGTLTFNAEDPALSTVTATAQTNSVQTDYPGTDRDFNAELQNSQWFDAATYPAITFSSTSVERTGPNTGRLTGDLAIRGQTHPVTFDVTYNSSYARHPMGPQISLIGFSAHAVVRRSQYGLNVLLPATGTDVGVADEVDVNIEAEFTRPVQTSTMQPAAEPAQPAPAN